MLLGRERECAGLDALISRIRGGASAVLVVEGEAGIGKTSLLEYAAAQAKGFRVLRARGAESEQDLPFAGLADLLAPIITCLDALPEAQRVALASALVLGPVAPADLFAICAATLSLLTVAAASQPVLALVDDAQWLDAASARAVEFTARRLGEEPIGLVVAARRPAPVVPQLSPHGFYAAGADTMEIAGLNDASAMQLLATSGHGIAAAVAERLVKGVGGNPLALLELPAALTDAQLTGYAVLPEPLPVGAALRHAFARRLEAMKPETHGLLLLVAAAPLDLATLQRAGGLLGLDLASLPAAEDADLVRVRDGQVEFTHPLLRSACYYAAAPARRRSAHRALADVTDPNRDPIRRAWHLAAAAAGPDEAVAASLDVAALAARGRNAFSAASHAHRRAAELSADPDRQASRWMAAGHAAHLGGDPGAAMRLLRRVLDLTTDARTRADAHVMLAHAASYTSPPMDFYYELAAAADEVLTVDPARAAVMLALATNLCIMGGRFELAAEAADRATGLAADRGGIAWLLSHVMQARVTILRGDRPVGRRILSAVLGHPDAVGHDPVIDLVRMLCGQSLAWCEDLGLAGDVLRSSVDAARTLGRVADMPYGLATLADVRFRADEWSQAYACATEAVELGTDWTTRTDQGYTLACLGRIEAAMGMASARVHLAQAAALARPRGVASVSAHAAAAAGLLELGSGNYELAAAELAVAAALTSEHGVRDPCVVQWRPDYIESLTRLGRLADAREQLAVLEAEAAATGSRWAVATAARCLGLLQEAPKQAVAHLEQAVAIAETSASKFEQARARLCLGQALRRGRQRGAAADQFGQALTVFEWLGAQPWAERTAKELATVGVSAARRREPMPVRLTPQELRVALLVAEGLSNQEIAVKLFVSHKTIEVHLGHIYDKLGVHSRTGLARLVHTGGIPQEQP
jgi:DNA-binding CsgD family transcriptional regulator